jgi:hypothetical protein
LGVDGTDVVALDVTVLVGLCLDVVFRRFETCVCGEVGSCRLLDRAFVEFVGGCFWDWVRLASMHLVQGHSTNVKGSLPLIGVLKRSCAMGWSGQYPFSEISMCLRYLQTAFFCIFLGKG